MGISRKNTRRLDPKLCYELWGRTGSVYKIPQVLKNEYGVFNQTTGKPYSHQGCFLALGNYILENLVEARPLFNQVWKANGRIATDQDWYKFVLDKARYLTPKKFQEFMSIHSYLTPYLEQ